MKILCVTSGLDPATGGTATAAVGLAVAARAAGAAVTMLIPHNPHKPEIIAENIAMLVKHDVTVILKPFGGLGFGGALAEKWGFSLAMAGTMWRRGGNYDLIHAHSPYVFSSVMAVLAAKHHSKKFILSPHEGLTRFDRGKASFKPLIRLKNYLARFYRRHSDAIIFCSDLELRDSEYRLDDPRPNQTARPFLLPLPVTAHATPKARPQRDQDAPIQIGYLGRIDGKKNLPILISALSLAVKRDHAKLHLTVAGSGDHDLLRQIQHQAGSHNLQEHVTWLGFVNQSEREKFLTQIEILLVPSVFESFGLVAAEAMAQGVPVIASPTVGVADDVTNYQAGLVIPPRPDALAVALTRLNRADLAEWGAAARRLVAENYSQAAIAKGLGEIYREMSKISSFKENN